MGVAQPKLRIQAIHDSKVFLFVRDLQLFTMRQL